MIYVRIDDTLYPAKVYGIDPDRKWDDRHSKAITMDGDYAFVDALFQNGTRWFVVVETLIDVSPNYKTDENGDVLFDESGEPIPYDGERVYQTTWQEEDCSEFNIRGDLTAHTNGTCTVKMGKITELEKAKQNAISAEELDNAYLEGVNEA